MSRANYGEIQFESIIFDLQILSNTRDISIVSKLEENLLLSSDDLLQLDIFVSCIIDYYMRIILCMRTCGLKYFINYIINRSHEVKKFIIDYSRRHNLNYSTITSPINFMIPSMNQCSRNGNLFLPHEMGDWFRKQSILMRVLTILRFLIKEKFTHLSEYNVIYYSNEITLKPSERN